MQPHLPRNLSKRAELLFNHRFSRVDAEGFYLSHQPIYGFRMSHAEPLAANKYVRSYAILKALSHLRFSSMFDVGGGESYKSGLVSSLLGAKFTSTDISSVVCKTAEDLFEIPSASSDIMNLPFADGQFDVVLCSETLEHVENSIAAAYELLRVAKDAVVITAPHDPEDVIAAGANERNPLGHMHGFDETTFDYLEEEGLRVTTQRILNWLTMVLGVTIEGMPVDRKHLRNLPHGRHVKLTATGISYIYNMAVPFIRTIFGMGTMARLIELDEWFCRTLPTYSGIISIVLKNEHVWTEDRDQEIEARQLLKYSVSNGSSVKPSEWQSLTNPEVISAQ